MVLTWGGRTNHMSVVEIWENDAAREAHITSDHMKDFRKTLMPISGAMYERTHLCAGGYKLSQGKQ